MQNQTNALDWLLVTLAAGIVFDTIYLLITVSKWRGTLITLLVVFAITVMTYWLNQRSDYPWDKLGVLFIVMLAITIAGICLIIISTVLAIKALFSLQTAPSASRTFWLIFHLFPPGITILILYLFAFLKY